MRSAPAVLVDAALLLLSTLQYSNGTGNDDDAMKAAWCLRNAVNVDAAGHLRGLAAMTPPIRGDEIVSHTDIERKFTSAALDELQLYQLHHPMAGRAELLQHLDAIAPKWRNP